MRRFQNKLILVSGASSGIGMATAQKLAREGARIVGVGRDIERLQKALNTFEGSNHHAIAADVGEESQIDSIIKFGQAQGGYHGGVCCAGMHEFRPLFLLKSDHLLKSYHSNVLTAMHCLKAVTKAASPDGASIVWLSSVAAIRGTAGFAAYSISKGALIAGAKVAAVELAKKKIRINTIVAGVIDTAMSEGWMKLCTQAQREEISRNHLLGIGKPENVADAIGFLLSSDAQWITGTTLVVDGGLSAH